MSETTVSPHRPALLRPAVEDDVDSIWRLLGVYAERRLLLPREKSDIRARLPVFTVAELDGRFAGCVAVRDFGAGLFEIRSLAVPEEFNGRWIGTSLVHGAVERLRATPPPRRVFALTLRPGLFVRAGFKVVDKSLFPQKIWSDCSQCPKKDCCDETAVLLELN